MFMQKNIGVLKSSNLCSEIYLYSDHQEYAVCVLSSIALPTFVLDGYSDEELKQPEEMRRKLNHEFPVNPYFDYKKLIEITKLVMTNLNHIVDKTYHPLEETKRGNDRHRPVGIGVQGLDDCYAKMRFPFKSKEAHDLNKKIFETIYFAAITQSSILARKLYQSLKKKCILDGKLVVYEHQPNSYDLVEKAYTNPDEIPKTIGSYPSMLWNGGSPIGNGVFHWELYGLKPDQLSGMFDWESLRDHIKTFGVRNSLTVACMPTASTSQLLGNNECIEPYTSNIYKRNTLAGEYIVVKKYLMEDLYRLGLWNNTMKDYLLASNGSIQYIDGIPNDLKELYPTVWEIDQEVLIQQSIDRQPFVDQGQSLNLYVENLNKETWNKLMFKAWRGKLKTGKYYLHSRPAVTPQKFTIDPSKQEEMRKLLEKNKHGTAFMEPLREICEVCSS
jgi:ribonucleoside-diphosphate reductase alpha chain